MICFSTSERRVSRGIWTNESGAFYLMPEAELDAEWLRTEEPQSVAVPVQDKRPPDLSHFGDI